MLDLLLKKGAFSPQNFYKPPAISRTLAAPGGGVTYVSVCRRLYTLVPAIPLVLDALSMEVVLVSTSSGISARRQRGHNVVKVCTGSGQGRMGASSKGA